MNSTVTSSASQANRSKRGQRSRRASLLATTALVAGISVAGVAGAETVTWDGSNSTNWDTGQNWNRTPPKAPEAGDDAVLNDGMIANQPILSSVTPALLSTTVSAGTLTISATGSLISTDVALSGTGAILNQGNITGAVSVTGGTLTNDGGTLVAASGISVSGTGALIMTGTGSATGDVSVAGTGNLEIGATSTITGNVAIAEDGTASNAGEITGTLAVNGGTFDNAGDVTGATTVTDGVLNLNTDSDLSDTEALTVNGGTVNVNAADTVGTLSGTGGTLNFGTDGRLNTNVTADVTFAGNMTGSKAFGATYFEKLGAGILTLSGTNTVDGGGFEITDGTVRVSGGNAIGDNNVVSIGTATLELLSDETIGALADLSTATINLNANTLTFAGVGVEVGSTVAGTINGTGNLTYNAPDLTTTFTGALNYTGTTTVTGGEFQLGASDIMADASSIVVNGGTLNLQTFNETVSAVSLSSGSIIGTGTLTGSTYTQTGGTLSATLSSAGDKLLEGGTIEGTIEGAGVNRVQTGTVTLEGTIDGAAEVVSGGTLDITTGQVTGNVNLGDATTAGSVVIGNDTAITGQINVDTTGGSTISYADGVNEDSAINLNAASVNLNVESGDTATQTGDITTSPVFATAGVTKQGDGTLIFAGALTYDGGATGTVTVSGGTLDITGSVAGDVTVADDGRLRISNSAAIGGTITTTGSVVSYANGVVEDSALIISSATTQLEVLDADAAEQAGVISGTDATFGFEKIGTGTLTLSAANSYTGATVISAGTLDVTGSIGSGSVVVEDTASLIVDGASLTDSAAVTLNDSGNLTVNSAVETIGSLNATNAGSTVVLNAGLIVGDDTDTTVAGVISGAGGLTKTGSGTLALTGTNTYSGLTLLEEGTVSIDNDAALGTGNLTLSGGTLLATADASLTKSNVTFEESSGLAASSGQTLSITAAELFAAPVADTTITFGSASQTGIVELGVTALASANNTIVTADIVGGTLRIGNNFAATSLLGFTFDATQIGADGTLDINGFTTIVSNLTGAGAVTNDGGAAATLRLSGTSNFGGVIQDGTSATGLQVIGGTPTLTGANTYTGATLLSDGNLTLSGGGSLASTDVTINATRVLTTQGGLATGTVLVNDGSLVLTGSDEIGSIAGAGAVDVDANTLTVGGIDTSTTFSGTVSGTGTLIKTGTGTLTLSANITADNLTVQDGTLLLSGDNSAVDLITVGGGGVGEVGRLRLENDLAGGQKITTLGSVISYGDGITMATPIELNSDDTQLEVVLAGETATQSGIISEIGGARPIEKIGAGTLTLSADNSYTGTTTVTAGTLNVTGNIDSTAVIVQTAGTLNVDGASLLDTASVTLNGSGVMNLSGSETIGSLAGAAGSSVVLGTNTLTFGDASNTTMAGVISGIDGALTKNGSGTTILSNTNLYTGATTVNDGLLDIAGSVASTTININGTGSVQVDGASLADTATVTLTGSGDLSLAGDETIGALSSLSADATVQLNDNQLSVTTDADQTFAGVISGTPASAADFSLTKSGTGNLLLTGQNTFTGQLELLGGSVTLNNAGGNALADTVIVNSVAGTTLALQTDETIGLLSGALAVMLGTNTLTFNGTPGFSAVHTGVISGSGGVTNAGAVQTLGGTNSYTGTTTVTAGTLTLANGAAIVDSGDVVVNGGTLVLAASETIGSLAGTGGTVSLGTSTLTTGDADSTSYAGVITGTGGLVKDGAGTFTLSGENTYTGATDVTDGTLIVSGSLDSTDLETLSGATLSVGENALTTAAVVTNAGTFEVTGDNSIGSVSGAGGISLVGAGTDLTLNAGTSTITGVISGDGGLVVADGSDTVLSGNNTYTGGTTITGGSLTVEAGGTLGAVTGSTAISNGVLTINTDVTQDTVTQSGGTINGTGVLTATTAFIHTGVTISSEVVAPVFAMTNGTITAPDGHVTATTSATLTGTNQIDGTLAGAGTGATTIAGGTTTLGATGLITNMVSLDVDAGAALVTGGAQQISDTTVVTVDGTLTLGGAETLSGLNGAATGVVNTGGNTLSLGTTGGSFAGAINGTGGLVVTGGTQVLTGANGYTGATNVTGGNLTLSGSGSIVSTDVTINATGTLTTQGGLADGTVLVSDGALVLTGDEEIGSLAGAGTVDVAGNTLTTGSLDTDTAFSGVVSGTGSLLKTGTGTQTLSGDNTVTNLTVEDGTLLLSGDNTGVATVTVGGGTGDATLRVEGTESYVGGQQITTLGSVISYGDSVNMATPIALNSDDTQLEVLGADAATQSGIISEIDGPRPIEKIGTGTLTLSADNTYTGTTTVTAGTLNITGSIASTAVIVQTDGTLGVDGASLLDTASVTLNGFGAMNLTGSETIGSLTGTSDSSVDLGGNTLTVGDADDTTMAGNISGTGGLTKVGTGQLTLSGTNDLTGALNVNEGTIDLTTGSVAATVVNVDTDGTLNVVGGGLAGAAITLTNDGIVNADGATISGAITNNLTFNAQGANLTGSVNNTATGVFDFTGGNLTGTVTNAGDFILSDGAVSGVFNNTGTLTALGMTSVGGLTGSGTVSLLTPELISGPQFDINTMDRLTINGPLSDANFVLDLNMGSPLATDDDDVLINPNGGTSDVITVTGAVTGTLNFDFRNKLPDGVAPFLGDSILVLDGAVASDYAFTYSGLGAGGAVIYSLAKNGDDLEIISETSAGIGGVAANASLIQSLIGTVVNRPTSPFVSGLASEEGCSHGGYFRGTYGTSTVSGTSNNGISSSESSVRAKYFGVQGGYDFGCNDGRFFDGWDGSFGALVGYNKGSSDQDVIIGVSGGGTAVASVTHSDFDQQYVGAYAAFSKDRITADVQVRLEKSDFTLNETVNPGFFGLGLSDANFSTDSVNVTGRVSYRMDLNDSGLNFVPTGGLSYTRTSDSTVNFTGGETLRIDAFDSIVGFVGGTIAKTTIAPAGNAGTTYFGSANYYHDFASDRKSVFTDSLGGTQEITTQSIGGFGELSMGVNYVRILEDGAVGAKQLNANVRLDTRFGSNVKNSSSITAQVRLSF